MKNLSTFFLIFSITLLLGGFNTFKINAQELSFKVPSTWEYNSSEDVFGFEIINNGGEYEGVLKIIAKPIADPTQGYEVYNQTVLVNAFTTMHHDCNINGEIGLPLGTYEFSIVYENFSGEMVEFLPARCKVVVKAPSVINRVPVTTTTTRPIIVTPTKIRRSSANEVRVLSSSPMKEVKVVNMTGNVVKSVDVANENIANLDLSDMNQGFYIIISNIKGKLETAKVIKVQ